MIHSSATAAIKRAQKESLLLREVSKMFHTITMEDSRLLGLFVNRVELSTDKGWCTIFFYTVDGFEKYSEQFEILKLYKPSMRKGLSMGIKGRYVPDLKFEYDSKFEKQQRLEKAMAQAALQTEAQEENFDEDAE
jgi:ribosome-binding factor A